MNSPTTTIFVVDDDAAVRDSLTLMLEQENLYVEAFATAADFLAAYRTDRFGCIIIDVRMPGMDGIQLQQKLIERGSPLPIIFLTGHGDIPTSVRAIKAGAVDFLTKPISREKLVAAVRAAIGQYQQALDQIALVASRLADLTEREREVMTLAVLGNPNKEIAILLGISHRTVEIHKSHIMHKTGAANLLDLARLAQDAGLQR